MFVGRSSELSVLEGLYHSDQFEMAVVYGRRRVGKTTLLDRFSEGKNPLYFTAQQESNVLNLKRFSEQVFARFGISQHAGTFSSWSDALGFVAEEAVGLDSPLLFVFDEFPYAAEADPSLPSTLQIAIDHKLKKINCCLVLCGSNEGFMESRVLGAKSPLYGRRTAQIRLKPFDFHDALAMVPHTSPQEALRYYATFGGTPYYLEQISSQRTYEQNIARIIFSTSGLLYSEPEMLLRQELREPATYNSVLTAIAQGATTPKEIAERSGVSRESVPRYLKIIVDLGLVEKKTPFGANPATSRKSVYSIADPFFAFWYRFVAPSVEAVELGAGAAVAHELCSSQALPTYEGMQFETVCMQWVARQNREGKLPFLATSFGKWWGTDPEAKEQVDIDLIAANAQKHSALFGECKWRRSFNETEALSALEHRSHLVAGKWSAMHYYLFTKNAVSPQTQAKADEDPNMHIVTADDMFGA